MTIKLGEGAIIGTKVCAVSDFLQAQSSGCNQLFSVGGVKGMEMTGVCAVLTCVLGFTGCDDITPV